MSYISGHVAGHCGGRRRDLCLKATLVVTDRGGLLPSVGGYARRGSGRTIFGLGSMKHPITAIHDWFGPKQALVHAALWITTTTLLWVAALPAQGEESAAKSRHQWGRHRTGAWKRVRIETETIDEKGNISNLSTTETVTTLTDVGDAFYTLRVEVKVDVAGKKFNAQPQYIRHGYYGEQEGQTVAIKKVGDATYAVNGVSLPVTIEEVVINGENSKRVMTIQRSEKAPLFALRRDCKATDAEGKVVQYTTSVEALALNMPQLILSEIHDASFVKTVHKQGKNTVVTVEVDCPSVPGGVVSHSLREEDEMGRVIRRSTLELLDYGTGDGAGPDSAAGRRRIFHRSRARNLSESDDGPE